MTTTVSGLFDRYDDASEAVSALEDMGISSTDISIVAKDGQDDRPSEAGEAAGAGAGVGATVGGVGGLLTGLGIMAIPGVGPVVAAGWLAATAAGAVAGAVVGAAAGGIVGAMTKEGVPEDDANIYAEGVRRGGTLVMAKVEDVMAIDAQAVIEHYKSVDVNERRATYQTEGWTQFDQNAPALTSDETGSKRNEPLV